MHKANLVFLISLIYIKLKLTSELKENMNHADLACPLGNLNFTGKTRIFHLLPGTDLRFCSLVRLSVWHTFVLLINLNAEQKNTEMSFKT